CQHYYNTPWTF
nr:immunoglobulin light chain junction region [Macaca mulatta]MOY02456.1 immunoglobulin light chain junction region [Macaca mulatta]MOY03380.1 immunoglobulin light chain junction region [Macaca mulatta]